MKQLLLILLLTSAPVWAQCSNTAYGSFTCKQSCNGHGLSGTTTTCAFGSNLTAGSMIYVMSSESAAGTISFSGCGLTWTTQSTSGDAASGTAPNSGTSSCTVTQTHASGDGQIVGVEITGSNQTVDGTNLKASAFVSSGSSITGTALSTNIDGDLVLGGYNNVSFGGGTYTATGSWVILVQTTSYGAMIEAQVQSTHGSIQATATSNSSNSYQVGTLGLELGSSQVVVPSFSPAAGTFTTSLPISPTITTSTSSATICYTVNGNTPTAAIAGTCDSGSGITSLSNGGSITITQVVPGPPAFSVTVKAIGTLIGDTNSTVASGTFTITPRLATINGITVGASPGNIYTWLGQPIGLYTGQINAINGLVSPSPTRDYLIDFETLANTAPTTITLGTSTHGTGTITWSTSNAGASLIGAAAAQLSNVVGSITVNGTNYNGSGSEGLQCTTTTSAGACGLDIGTIGNASGGSMSIGFNFSTTCATSFSQCGAMGGLTSSGGTNYAVLHVNPAGSSNGFLYLETNGSPPVSTSGVAYTVNTVYRVNIQFNAGLGATHKMTVCQINNPTTLTPSYAFLGSITGVNSGSTSGNPALVYVGVSGEEPTTGGIVFNFDNYVINLTGLFSTTSCVL